MSLIELEYVKYRIGEEVQQVLIDAPHATPPCSEPPTGAIADSASQTTGCHCIIGTVSRTEADLNRSPAHQARKGRDPEAIYEYRDAIRRILVAAELIGEHGLLERPFFHLQIHGMKDRSLDKSESYGLDIEVGTRNKTTCSPAVHDWIMDTLIAWSRTIEGRKEVIVGANQMFIGDYSMTHHRNGDGDDYRGYGHNFHSVQVEFAHWLRLEHSPDIERILRRAVHEFGTVNPNQ